MIVGSNHQGRVFWRWAAAAARGRSTLPRTTQMGGTQPHVPSEMVRDHDLAETSPQAQTACTTQFAYSMSCVLASDTVHSSRRVALGLGAGLARGLAVLVAQLRLGRESLAQLTLAPMHPHIPAALT